MSRQLPDLFDGCYDGEHRKLLAPEQFKQMFCEVCMNVGCRNSKGAGSKWNQRMLTQEDRLLNNPAFAPDMTAEIMGLPDFKNMIQDALRIEISTQRGDWEPVSDADVGRAAAEMMGVVQPSGFQAKPDPHPDPEPSEPPEAPEPPEKPPTHDDPACGQSDPPLDTPLTNESVEGRWRVRGDSVDGEGKPRTYTVTLHADDVWTCDCPSREMPCKHTRYIQGRLAPKEPDQPPPDPVRPPPAPRRTPFPSAMNTNQPQGGVMVGGEAPPPSDPADPWAVPEGPKVRKLDVGGRVTFGTGKK
jgi:hypothetical protein